MTRLENSLRDQAATQRRMPSPVLSPAIMARIRRDAAGRTVSTQPTRPGLRLALAAPAVVLLLLSLTLWRGRNPSEISSSPAVFDIPRLSVDSWGQLEDQIAPGASGFMDPSALRVEMAESATEGRQLLVAMLGSVLPEQTAQTLVGEAGDLLLGLPSRE